MTSFVIVAIALGIVGAAAMLVGFKQLSHDEAPAAKQRQAAQLLTVGLAFLLGACAVIVLG